MIDYFLTYYRAIIQLRDSGEFVEAMKKCKEILSLEPDFNYVQARPYMGNVYPEVLESLRNQGYCPINMDREYEDVIICYDRILERNPDNLYIWYNKSIALQRLKKYKEAIECCNKIIKSEPQRDNELIIKIAETFEKIIILKIELEKNQPKIEGKTAEEWFDLAKTEENANNMKMQIECFDKCLDLEPDNVDILFEKEVCLSVLKKGREALKCIDKILEIEPLNARAWYSKGHTLLQSKKYKEAIGCLNKCLEIEPERHNAWYSKGIAFYEMGKCEEALKCFNITLKEWEEEDKRGGSNTIPSDLIYKANTLRHLGRYKEALRYYERILKSFPDDLDALKGRREVLNHLNLKYFMDDEILKKIKDRNLDIFDKFVSELTPMSDEEINKFCNENQIPNKLKSVVKALFCYMSLGFFATAQSKAGTETFNNDTLKAFRSFLEPYVFKNTTKEERRFLHEVFSQQLKGAPTPDKIFHLDKNFEVGARLTNKALRDIVALLEKERSQE